MISRRITRRAGSIEGTSVCGLAALLKDVAIGSPLKSAAANEWPPVSISISDSAKVSVPERNIARIDVLHKDAVCLEGSKDCLHFQPARTKLLLFLGTPIGKDFVGKVRRPVEVRAGETEDERAADDGHFDDPEV